MHRFEPVNAKVSISDIMKNLLLKGGDLGLGACHKEMEKHLASADITECPEQEWVNMEEMGSLLFTITLDFLFFFFFSKESFLQ